MIIDTDVLIWYMKGNEKALQNFVHEGKTVGEKLKISQPAVSLSVKCLKAIGYTPQLLVKSLTVTYKLMHESRVA